MRGIHFVAIGQCVTLVIVSWIAVAPASSGHSGETLSGSSFSELEASIEGLEDRISSLDGRLQSWGARRGEPTQDENEAKRVRATPITLEDLKTSIEKLRASVVPATSSRRKSLHMIRKQNPRINWAAIDTIRNKRAINYENAQKSVQLLSPAEVLMRFGSPSKVETWKMETYWTYYRYSIPEDPKSEKTGSFVLYFRHGMVTRFEMHLK